jgi:hypothetical protein
MAMLEGAGIALDNSLITPCDEDHYEEPCKASQTAQILWGSII